MRQVIGDFEIKNSKVNKIVLTGGSVGMPGLLDNFKENFEGLDVKMGNAFEDIFYPTELKPFVSELSSTYSIALGEALKILE